MPKPDPENMTPVQRVRLPAAAWQAFGRACRQQGVFRSRCLFDLMWGYVRRHGSAEDKAAFAAADKELRERRSRKHSRAA